MKPPPPVTRIFIKVTLIEAEVVKAVRADVAPAFVRGVLVMAATAPEVAARLPDDGGTVAVRITSDEEMARLNRAYAGEDQTTDVLSFAGTGKHVGYIAISWPAVVRQSREYGQDVKIELALLAVDGPLLLSGYDDAIAADRIGMSCCTRTALKLSGMPLAGSRL